MSREDDLHIIEREIYGVGLEPDEEPNATITREDIEAIESLSDAAIRSGDTQTAVKGYALALRLRAETGLWPQRRKDD